MIFLSHNDEVIIYCIPPLSSSGENFDMDFLVLFLLSYKFLISLLLYRFHHHHPYLCTRQCLT